MLDMIFPKTHHRYAALPLLGSLVDAFAVWLSQCDYRPETIRVDQFAQVLRDLKLATS